MLTDGLHNAGIEILQKQAEIIDRAGIEPKDLKEEEVKNSRCGHSPQSHKDDKEIIEASERLKVIGRCGVGVDNIDLETAKNSGVTVVNAPTATTTSVAELTIGLMISLAREIPRADMSMKDEKWIKKEFKGTELAGKALGMIGFGSISDLKLDNWEQDLVCIYWRHCNIYIPCTNSN